MPNTLIDTTSEEFLTAAKDAFKQVFKGYCSAKGIDESVYLGKDDPGEWSPKSILVVHKENGLPDRYYYPQSANRWDIVEKRLAEIIGCDVYFEEINGAVTALYFV